MINGETVGWEESQRQLIAHDINLLQTFQIMKYINGEHLPRTMANVRD